MLMPARHRKKASGLQRQATASKTVLLANIVIYFTGQAYAQQTLATYNISNALESVNTASFTIASLGTSSLLGVDSLIILAPTGVQAESCLAGSYSPSDAQTCTLCPTGTYSQATTATSIDTCISCGAGKYQNMTGASSESHCINCPANTYFTGTRGTSISVCTPCPIFSTSFPGSQLPESCICAPGYSGPNGENNSPFLIRMHKLTCFSLAGGPCLPCNTSVWCLNGQANPCPPNSNASALSSSISQCLCIPGYFGDTTMSGVGFPTLCQVREKHTLFTFCILFIYVYWITGTPLSTPKQ